MMCHCALPSLVTDHQRAPAGAFRQSIVTAGREFVQFVMMSILIDLVAAIIAKAERMRNREIP
jgi:hypothetical protein